MSNTTDLNIFTNSDSIKMVDRMRTILSHAEYFDCLVGYFRITGFYLLKENLEKVKEIRFLVGLGTDSETSNAITLTLFDQNAFKIKPILQKQIREEFENSEDSLKIENGINTFIEWIKNGKIKIKMCADKNVHAKVYIVRNNAEISALQYGNVITGSSNFSYNGLEKNVEFNVELKNRNEIDYSLLFFNNLWNDAIDVTDIVEEVIQKETWMNVSVTPYKMFLKTLYSYFEDEIGDNHVDIELPDDFIRLEYQEHAVIQAKKILEKHGGVFIADVVGLGKTYIAAMLGKYLGAKKRCLFIVPPVVQEYWKSVLEDFNYTQRDKVVSLGIIDQVAQWDDLGKYDYVFIDEAHRFRNAETKEFNYLKQICYGKGVILITATPQNNYITDIVNLISLFQDLKQSSIIPGNPDLDGFFRGLKTEIYASKNEDNYAQVLDNAMSEIRDKVLKQVMVRRTRTEVMKYYADNLQKQGLKFPILHDPERETYTYSEQMDLAFNETIQLLSQLHYARYTPLLYVKPERQKIVVGDRKSGQENIKGFIKALLIKRLESSIYAFNQTIEKMTKSHHDFLKLYDQDKIVIGNLSRNNNFDIDYLIDLDDSEFEQLITERDLTKINKEDLTGDYDKDLKSDIEIFDHLKELWTQFDIEHDDAKYDELVKLLKQIKKKDTRIIIFSEAKDTVKYLEKRMNDQFNNQVVSFSGSDSDLVKEYIKRNFDPKSKAPLNEKSILITTDAMSEGINLHRASIIINYDLPWNPTRVMQRVGRINRVGSNFNDLYVFNFFPAANTRQHLSLEDSIKIKIQMFHSLLGEDSKYLTNEEKVDQQAFFDILMMKNFKLTDEGEQFNLNAVKMEYLKLINDIKKNDPLLFDEIKSLPNKLRIARKSSENTKLVTFVKKGTIKEFFYTDGTSSDLMDFEKAMKLLKADIDSTKINVPNNYYDCLNLNINEFKEKVQNSFDNGYKAKGTPKNLKKINQYLMFLKHGKLTYENEDLIVQVQKLIDDGVLTNYIYKEILKAIDSLKSKNDLNAIANCFSENIPNVYFKGRKQYEVQDLKNEKEIVILSEYFIKEA